MNESVRFGVTPSAPRYFQFGFPPGIDTAIISMESPDDICMTMSVQNISCPVYDLDRDVHFEGSFQTVDNKTGMSIRRDQYPNGLHIVFVVKPTNLACVNSFSLNPFTPILPPAKHVCHGPCREKTVEFKIMKKITKQEYLYATFGALGLFLATYVLVVLVSCIMCVRTWRLPSEPGLQDLQTDTGAPDQVANQHLYLFLILGSRWEMMAEKGTLTQSTMWMMTRRSMKRTLTC
jgi:hypothetical protein